MPDTSQESSVKFALIGLKSLILLNGGGVLAVLTFAGNLKGRSAVVSMMALSVELFVWGLIAAMFCILLSYAAQELETQNKEKGFQSLRAIAVITSLSSLTMFSLAAIGAAQALKLL
ncbi:MAG: hypothetical protein JKY34_11805 [Kordiimonadaceae bacterium]|nr:hypothetical protein [Kordiimonadaceae bacterium]